MDHSKVGQLSKREGDASDFTDKNWAVLSRLGREGCVLQKGSNMGVSSKNIASRNPA